MRERGGRRCVERERGEREEKREEQEKEKKKERETRRGGRRAERNYYCPTGFFSAHRRLVSAPLLFLLHLRTQGANVPALQFRAKIANGTPREKERRRRVCLVEEKKGSLCAPSKQAARTVHQSRKTVRRSRRKMPSNCAFLRINLRNLSHCGNSRERKETRRAGYRAREHARRKARIPKTRASDRALRSKPLQRASLADLAPSLSRARALFRSLSRAMLTDEIARQYETEKHLRAARPGGASGREASLEFFFPLGKS